MDAIQYQQLDSRSLAEVLRPLGITVTEVEGLTNKVPHVVFGGAAKSTYYSPKSHRTIYVLERNSMYAADTWSNDVWLFDRDFTAEEASAFIADFDAAKRGDPAGDSPSPRRSPTPEERAADKAAAEEIFRAFFGDAPPPQD